MTDAPVVDARGMRCPWPALRAARAMRGSGKVRVLADDPIAAGELKALADAQGWAIFQNGPNDFVLQKQPVILP